MDKEETGKLGDTSTSIKTEEDSIKNVTEVKEIIEETETSNGIDSDSKDLESNNNIKFINEEELYKTESQEKKSNKKLIMGIASVIAIILLIVGGAFAYYGIKINNIVKSYEDKVYPEAFIKEVNVGGMTKEELTSTLEGMLNDFGNQSIKVSIGDNTYEIAKRALDLSVNFEPLVDEIMSYGKDNKLLDKLNLINEPQKREYDFEITYSDEGISEFVQNIAEEVYVEPVNASIFINGSTPNVTAGIVGNELDSEALISEIKLAVEDMNGGDVINIEGALKEAEPEITTAALQSVNGIIGTHTTTFSAGPSGTNIQIGAGKVDNTLLMPGQQFSMIDTLGPTTAENGFVLANTYMNGQVVPGYGGGVCQIATTLYNAELKSGIIPLERTNHMMTVGYAPVGLDATIGDYAPDLIFENPYDYPIVIRSYTNGGSLTVEFWSNTSATNGIRYEPKAYADGLYADTYLYGYDANGNVVSEQYLNSSSYMPFQ